MNRIAVDVTFDPGARLHRDDSTAHGNAAFFFSLRQSIEVLITVCRRG
jgi:hypothetical protein